MAKCSMPVNMQWDFSRISARARPRPPTEQWNSLAASALSKGGRIGVEISERRTDQVDYWQPARLDFGVGLGA